MKTTQNIFSKSVFTAGVLFGLLLVFSPAFSLTTGAQDDPAGLQPLQETGLSTTDPRIITANIINAALGLLGTITIVLIVYGGFLWMTAAGNDDAVAKAKKIMIAGVIGLAIILSAYALATYIVESILEATV